MNTADALSWLTASAEAGNPYAEYLLGKLYWEGEAVPPNKEQAIYWLTWAVEQGHTHAQILLERQDSSFLPSAILAVNNLLHQMGRIKASANLNKKIKQEVPVAAKRYQEELLAEINADREAHGKKPF